MTEKPTAVVQQEPFVLMDQAEELELIEAMVAGQAEIATYVYHIQIKTKSGPRDVYGLSLPGATAALRAKCLRRLERNLPPMQLEFKTTEDRFDERRNAWLCEVQIRDKTTGMIGVGRVYQPIYFDKEHKHANQFADRIAFSKAKRNAIRDFLDEEFIKTMIQLYIEQGRKTTLDADAARANRVQNLIKKTTYLPKETKAKRLESPEQEPSKVANRELL